MEANLKTDYVDDQLIKRALVTKKKEYRELPIDDLVIVSS